MEARRAAGALIKTMARGFDSKSVSDQQDELQRRRERTQGPQKTVVSARRRQLELARIDLLRRLEAAPERYRESLQGALTALDEQLKQELETEPEKGPRGEPK